jgi:hypothetical protein
VLNNKPNPPPRCSTHFKNNPTNITPSTLPAIHQTQDLITHAPNHPPRKHSNKTPTSQTNKQTNKTPKTITTNQTQDLITGQAALEQINAGNTGVFSSL